MQQHAALLLLLLSLWWPSSLLSTASDLALPSCFTDEDKQFVVTVATNDPLGLRLSEKLEVLEFVADSQGRSRAVEASGLAEIGDRLVQVNDVSLLESSLENAVAALAAAKAPKVLRFQTHDGRCLRASTPPPSKESSPAAGSTEASAGASTTLTDSEATFDYLLLSLGDKDSEQTFFGVLSADGKPPSCNFRQVEIAFPFDACEPLSTNATDKYLVVPSMAGCPAHQKAAFAQDSDAKGVIFVQYEGKKPQQIKLPAEMPKPIVLPLVMISMDSGIRMIEQISRVHPTQSPQIRFVFSKECASNKFQVHPNNDPLALSVQAQTHFAIAGFLTIATADSGSSTLSTTAYEFLKPSSLATHDGDDHKNADAILESTKLPLGKHDVIVPDHALYDLLRPCYDREPDLESSSTSISARKRTQSAGNLAMRALQESLQGQWVAVRLQSKCSLSKQLEYFASLQVSGVIFGDEAFPKSVNVQHLFRQLAIPFVVVSLSSLQSIQQSFQRMGSVAHIQVEFAGENALLHHWSDLAELADPVNWPSSEITRDRLFHRVLKDHATVTDQDSQLQLARNERYDSLVAFYWKAQRFYSDSKNSNEE